MEVEIKCPYCESGFVEEIDSRRDEDNNNQERDRSLPLWAPILLGMLGDPSRRRRHEREEEDERGETDHERYFESILRRRRRSNAILRLLQGIRASESNNTENEREEHVILINPFNQAIILQGTFDSSQTQNRNHDTPDSLGDYFIGSGLEMLLQHLAENDPNRYGTPPAKQEAVEALPTVTIKENLQCPICLEDFEIGTEGKEMPCKHKYHDGCILPWLELHSSCPVCRFQMPFDGSKDTIGSRDGNVVESTSGDRERGNGRSSLDPMPWHFSGLLSMSDSGNGDNSSSPSSSSPSSSTGSTNSRRDDN
eukprot:TRINITY_DN20534_c0_g1_i1.p1 TRINITY_DN20534_c0_g1~~TRINITY_DN20534_c0_g1_i1.p1  ORF type:complete len:347 (-),score=52.42 TRINITY_DN20534_c0_g1_i1:186-1115(-)